MVKVGDRVKVLYLKDDPAWNNSIHSCDEGVVESIDKIDLFNETQIWVKFDEGSYLTLLEGIDRYEVI